jgi:O-antigen/teichoic acid export membrane protein
LVYIAKLSRTARHAGVDLGMGIPGCEGYEKQCRPIIKMAAGKVGFRLLGNSAWNAIAFLVSAALNLLVIPFVVIRLGVAAFGVAGLVTACVAPALALTAALASSATREFAQRLEPHEREEARRFFATALWLAGTLGTLVALLLAVGGPLLARRAFNLDGNVAADLAPAFAFGAVGWLCQTIATVFWSAFTARQDYRRQAYIAILSTIVSTSSTLVLVPRWPQASTFLGCQALGLAISLPLSGLIAWRAFRAWLAWPGFHMKPFRRLTSVGGWQFIARSGGLIAAQADRYLLGAFLAPQFVGFYTIASRLQEAVYLGISRMGDILLPFFSTLQKSESSERVADLLFRASWVLNVLAAGALGALIPVAGPLLHAWTGAEVASEAQALLVVLCISGMLGCSGNVFTFFLLASGRSRSTALISAVTAIFTMVTSAIALPLFGWQAAGWSSCVGMTAQMVITMSLLRRSFDLADIWARVGHFVLLPLATGMVSALVLRYVAGDYLSGLAPHWWSVGCSYVVGASIIFVVVAAVSRIGPYGDICWRDVRLIASRFLPLGVF